MASYKNQYPDGITPYFWENFVVPRIKELKGNMCENCKSKYNLDVHHLDYSNEVSINTLKLICRSCHKLAHSNKNI